MSTGMPNMIQQRMAVNISSKADAKVLRMELRFRRNNEVTMPIPALLATIAKTPGWQIDEMASGVKA